MLTPDSSNQIFEMTFHKLSHVIQISLWLLETLHTGVASSVRAEYGTLARQRTSAKLRLGLIRPRSSHNQRVQIARVSYNAVASNRGHELW